MPLTLTTQPIILVMVAVIIALLSLVFAVSALTSSSRLRRRFKKWRDIHSSADLEDVYQRTLGEVASLRQQLSDSEAELQQMRRTLRTKVSTPVVLRYNAFSELGSDLSYSVAIVDEDKNGVVLSSIYGREESRTYAKPVEQGESHYPLTDEELDVLGLPGQGKVQRRSVHV